MQGCQHAVSTLIPGWSRAPAEGRGRRAGRSRRAFRARCRRLAGRAVRRAGGRARAYSELLGFLRLAWQKLQPGGVLIAETVNPHAPGTLKSFWTDPTHQRPLFPEALLTLCRGERRSRGLKPASAPTTTPGGRIPKRRQSLLQALNPVPILDAQRALAGQLGVEAVQRVGHGAVESALVDGEREHHPH